MFDAVNWQGNLHRILVVARHARGPSAQWLDNFSEGAPALAPLLFPKLVLLAGIGLWVWGRELPVRDAAGS